MRDRDCEKYIGEANEADGFFGAGCGTFLGGFSGNCDSQFQAARINRDNCYASKARQARNDEITRQIVGVLKWAAILVIVFFVMKWYLN
jgi:hypothetical protein